MDDELRAAIEKFNAEVRDAALAKEKQVAAERKKWEHRSNGQGKWPCVSGLGGLNVLPSEVEAHKAYCRQMGVPTEITAEGHIIYESQSHQNKYCKLRKASNLDRYY